MKLLDVVLAGLLFGAAHGVVAAEYVEEKMNISHHMRKGAC